MTKLKKIAAIAAVLIFGASFLSGTGNNQTTRNVVYTTYQAQTGDTFWDIANRYYNEDSRGLYLLEYQDEIRRLNPDLAERQYQLQPGDTVNICYYKD